MRNVTPTSDHLLVMYLQWKVKYDSASGCGRMLTFSLLTELLWMSSLHLGLDSAPEHPLPHRELPPVTPTVRNLFKKVHLGQKAPSVHARGPSDRAGWVSVVQMSISEHCSELILDY